MNWPHDASGFAKRIADFTPAEEAAVLREARTRAAIARWQIDGRPDGGEGLHRALVAQPNFAALGLGDASERN